VTSDNAQKNSRYRLSGCFRNCRKRRKHKFWVNRSCDPAHRSEQTIGKHIARTKPEFIAKCGDSLRELEETAYWLELLVDGKIVVPEKLSNLRQECSELIAIFVTILKRSKEGPS